jgi:hypothetical protein
LDVRLAAATWCVIAWPAAFQGEWFVFADQRGVWTRRVLSEENEKEHLLMPGPIVVAGDGAHFELPVGIWRRRDKPK